MSNGKWQHTKTKSTTSTSHNKRSMKRNENVKRRPTKEKRAILMNIVIIPQSVKATAEKVIRNDENIISWFLWLFRFFFFFILSFCTSLHLVWSSSSRIEFGVEITLLEVVRNFQTLNFIESLRKWKNVSTRKREKKTLIFTCTADDNSVDEWSGKWHNLFTFLWSIRSTVSPERR